MTETDEHGIPQPPPGGSAAKRAVIAEAALVEFLGAGYAATSVDAVAAGAGVSKPTVYRYFGSKEGLFLAVVGETLRGAYAELPELGEEPGTALTGYLGALSRVSLRPRVLGLRRLVIGEVERFPQLGALWTAINERTTDTRLAEAFDRYGRAGLLALPDPAMAVRQVVSLTLGALLLPAIFRPDQVVTDTEVDHVVSAGVTAFLGRYALARR